MLVRIVAVGLSHALWKNVFHHLRSTLPGLPFAAGYFSTPEEIAYLEQGFVQRQWRREPADVVLTDTADPATLGARLDLLRQLSAGEAPPRLGLVLHTLTHGLRHLAQARLPLTVRLDNGAEFTLNDPALLVEGFPEGYPRLRLDAHLDALRLADARGTQREVRPQSLSVGSLIALNQVRGVLRGGETLEADAWLREVARTAKVRLPGEQPAALYREKGGLYLFPGVPVRRVRQVRLDGLPFDWLIDLGRLSTDMPGFAGLARAVGAAAEAHRERIEALTTRIRQMECRTDLPVRCIGDVPAVTAAMVAALRDRGYRQARALGADDPQRFDVPTLLLRLSEGLPQPPEQIHEPIALDLADAVLPPLTRLDDLLSWRELSPGPAAPPIDPQAFAAGHEALVARTGRARDGQAITERRRLLLGQELNVLEGALATLERLLAAPTQTWQERVPDGVSQALLYSYDAEEAQAVLQAMPGVTKRRWFDLSGLRDADTARNLDMELGRRYASGGAVFITPTARERTEALRDRLAAELAEQRQALEDAKAAAAQYGETLEGERDAAESLARGWIAHTVRDWLEHNEPRLLEALAVLRPRHEQEWFTRGGVNRIVLITATGENRKALLEACDAVYPQLNPELSVVVRYDFDPAEGALETETGEPLAEAPPQAGADGGDAAEREGPPPGPLEQYLAILADAVSELSRADLLLIEQQPEVAGAILEHLRGLSPVLAEAPAVLVLPDTWSPPEDGALPWPRTRVVPARRMGALGPRETATALRALYAL